MITGYSNWECVVIFFLENVNLQLKDVQLVVAFWFYWQSFASLSFQITEWVKMA